MARFTLGLSLAGLLAAGCTSTPDYTGGNGGGTIAGGGAETGVTTNGSGAGGSTGGTTGAVEGSAALAGMPFTPFAAGSGYSSVTPPDAGGAYTSFSFVLFANPLTCSQALTVSGNQTQLAVTVSSTIEGEVILPGSYSVGPNSTGTDVSMELVVVYSDGGDIAAFDATAGSTVIVNELDANEIQGSLLFNSVLPDGGPLAISATAIAVPYCGGLQ